MSEKEQMKTDGIVMFKLIYIFVLLGFIQIVIFTPLPLKSICIPKKKQVFINKGKMSYNKSKGN